MDKNKLYTLQNLVAWLLLLMGMVALICVGAVACQKEGSADVQGELPAGKYPIELTADELQEIFATPSGTRNTVDNDWNGVTTVAVQIGNEVKQYKAQSADGGATVTFTSDDPFYWENTTDKKLISAWHPYSETYSLPFKVKADQSTAENYQASDLIKGIVNGLTFADRNDPTKNKLTFSHQAAKVVVNLIAGDKVDLSEGVSVQLLNIPSLDTGSTLTPYKPDSSRHTYVALMCFGLIPANTQFIKITAGGNTFIYKTAATTLLRGGWAYTYDITVKADEIVVTEKSGAEWTDGGSENVVSRTLLAEYTAMDLKKGDYIYKNGTTSDGGVRMIYDNGEIVCEATKPQPKATEENPVVGIVFWTPSETMTDGRTTPARLTDDKIMAQDYPACIHGLAVSLHRYPDGVEWQTTAESVSSFQSGANFTHPKKADFVSIVSGGGKEDNVNRILGYQNTIVLRAYNDYCRANGKTDNLVTAVTALPSDVAPSGSTGWFLPSSKEAYMLCNMDIDDICSAQYTSSRPTRDIVDASLAAAGGDKLAVSAWSSTESSGGYVYVATSSTSSKQWVLGVRMVCAF